MKAFMFLIFLILSICCCQAQNDHQDLRNEIEQLKQKATRLEKKLNKLDGKSYSSREEADEYVGREEADEYVDEDYGNTFKVYWDNGFRMKTHNNNFYLAMGGFAFLDVGFVHEDQAVKDQLDEIEDFAKFRSVRPSVWGSFYDRYFFKIEFEFADNDDVAFRNVFVGVKGLPFNGKFFVGFYKEFMGLEELTNPADATFMELSLTSTFTPAFQLGASYTGHNDAKNMTFAIGLFREVEDASPPRVENDSGSYAVTTRLTALPYWGSKSSFIHVGASYSFRNPLNDEVQFKSRPEIPVGPQFVDTGVIGDVRYVQLAGLEFAFVHGPFSIQSEITSSWVRTKNRDDGNNKDFWAYYAYFTYTLTGESRQYKKAAGVFVRPKPDKSFLIDEGGIGAIELAMRYSYVDLNEDDIRGRRLQDLTFAVNWYLTPNIRFEVNYIHSILKNLDNSDFTDSPILLARVQIAF